MAETKIEWTSRLRADSTPIPGYSFNPWIGCTKKSAGCHHCYAETFTTNRMGKDLWGPSADRQLTRDAYWKQPLKWNEEAKEMGERRIVFCASLADVFEGPETCQNEEAYAKIQTARRHLFMLARTTGHLDWLFLTKRPENIRKILSETTHMSHPHTDWLTLQERNPRYNWWFGTSVEDQKAADERIPLLLDVPAAVRFLSCEPLIEKVDLRPYIGYGRYHGNVAGMCIDIDGMSLHADGRKCRTCGWGYPDDPCRPNAMPRIHWVIAGGESGSAARPMNPEWVRVLRDQCAATDTAFYFKQSGEFVELDDYRAAMPENARRATHTFDDHSKVYRLGKKATGAILDGREHRAFPRSPYSIELGQSGATR